VVDENLSSEEIPNKIYLFICNLESTQLAVSLDTTFELPECLQTPVWETVMYDIINQTSL
jgi:hypothetical protein